MTDQIDTWGGDDVHALSGPYALDALEPAEMDRFEAHLQRCTDCRAEVDSLREAAALLATDEVAPPPSVRDAVLSSITTIRPLPPLPASPDGSEDDPDPLPAAAGPDRTPRAPGAGGTGGAGGGDGTVVPLRASRWRRLGLLGAAAAVLVAAAVGGLWLKPWADDGRDETVTRLTAAEQVLAAPDATRVEQRFPDGAVATVVLSRDLGRAVIVTEDMPSAPEGKDYEVWLETPAGDMVKAGLMPDVQDTTLILDGDASEATGVGITVEPDGGSKRPTSDPIAYFSLS
ncbi:anti-sigma factor [Nocardioides sp. zg-ZUI104]|uniref:anti-sigma factor n=1 Tax=Nocardioides faecalis TaxID=2803858 RepID=UPI001BCDE290|nr:anti-sigma factor [Nocardioides faecalis]MBS4754472.1 anti-sigma factor [Nocardioides faecalis]